MSGPDLLRLKLDLAMRGVRLDAAARQAGLARPAAQDPRSRRVDLLLPGDLWVTVPVDEPLANTSPHLLTEGENGRHTLANAEDGTRVPVRAVPPPRFYARQTSRGTAMWRIATVHGTHLIVHPGATCGFSVRGTPCRFCVEGSRSAADHDAASVAEVVEVVRAAFDEGIVESVCLNSGVFDHEDGGIVFLAPYIEAVNRHVDTLVATQVHPPRTARWIDRTYAMGVDAISYNLELFDPAALNRHCVGRARYVGRERYLESLAHAARVFPRGTVWSDLVLGVESAASTRAGIEALTAMGVVPVVSIVRGEHTAADLAETGPILAHLYRSARRHGINMGWVRALALGVTPLEARHCAGDAAHLALTVQQLARSRLGARAARGLARLRRRLRVRRVSESFDAAHL
jgi:hypothetical protein